MENSLGKHLSFAALTLALGLAAGAYILGDQAKQAAAATGRTAITVKGLAEKEIQADRGELSITLLGHGATLPEALADLRQHRPALDTFVTTQGFTKADIEASNEAYEAVYQQDKEGRTTQVLDHYQSSQTLTLRSQDVRRITRADKAILGLQESGMAVRSGGAQYLVSGLENIKMSLIGAATDNAQARAEEFAKHGKAKVGSMRSASQGAFYILPRNGGDEGTNDYGGAYDKSTIDKIARVVVTIEYKLD